MQTMVSLIEESYYMNKCCTNFISISHSYYNDISLILYKVVGSHHFLHFSLYSLYTVTDPRFFNSGGTICKNL